MEIKGIDVSSVQGTPDWSRVAKSGIQFAILRVHQRYGVDSSFEHNYKGCRDNGILTGVYKYSYAENPGQAVQEADAVLKKLAGRGLDFPVFYDLEWEAQRLLGKVAITAIAQAFLDRIKEAGYIPAIYCNVDWYNHVLDVLALPYDYWLAAYPANDTGTIQERLRPSEGVGWQYSSKGSVPGIDRYVDLNVFYTDYKEPKKGESMTKIEAAVQQMEAWANDPTHGYDQTLRWGEKGDFDCSSAVIQACQNAGIPVKTAGATYTGNMYNVFLKNGFIDVTASINLSTGAGLLRGDVLLNHVRHVAMYCGNGKEVEASINEFGMATGGVPGDQTGAEFLIRPYRNYPWNVVLRHNEVGTSMNTGGDYMFGMKTVQKGETGNHVLLVQEILRARGFKGKNGQELALDRECGTQTVYAIKQYQKEREKVEPGIVGAIDGIAGPRTLQDMIAL